MSSLLQKSTTKRTHLNLTFNHAAIKLPADKLQTVPEYQAGVKAVLRLGGMNDSVSSFSLNKGGLEIAILCGKETIVPLDVLPSIKLFAEEIPNGEEVYIVFETRCQAAAADSKVDKNPGEPNKKKAGCPKKSAAKAASGGAAEEKQAISGDELSDSDSDSDSDGNFGCLQTALMALANNEAPDVVRTKRQEFSSECIVAARQLNEHNVEQLALMRRYFIASNNPRLSQALAIFDRQVNDGTCERSECEIRLGVEPGPYHLYAIGLSQAAGDSIPGEIAGNLIRHTFNLPVGDKAQDFIPTLKSKIESIKDLTTITIPDDIQVNILLTSFKASTRPNIGKLGKTTEDMCMRAERENPGDKESRVTIDQLNEVILREFNPASASGNNTTPRDSAGRGNGKPKHKQNDGPAHVANGAADAGQNSSYSSPQKNQGKAKGNRTPNSAQSPQSSGKGGKGNREVVCFWCNQKGHVRGDDTCPQKGLSDKMQEVRRKNNGLKAQHSGNGAALWSDELDE